MCSYICSVLIILVTPLTFAVQQCITCSDKNINNGYLSSNNSVERGMKEFGQQSLENEPKSRPKRYTFAWPKGSVFVMKFDVEVPLETPGAIDSPLKLEVGHSIYLTNFTLPDTKSWEDRLDILSLLEEFLNHLGIDGQSCILRAICEKNEYHVLPDGLLGEIISLILDFSGLEDFLFHHYKGANIYGEHFGSCYSKYQNCPISIFKWLY